MLLIACAAGSDSKEGSDEATPQPEGRGGGECADAGDNDGDGLFDCDDPDCAGSPDCEGIAGDTADTGGDTAAGDSGDTGTATDWLDLTGSWLSNFGAEYYDDNCTAEGLDADSETWIGAFTVDGTPPAALVATFGTDLFAGAQNSSGGVAFSGLHAHSAGALYATLAGYAYNDQRMARFVIYGTGVLGLDVDGDAVIDCMADGSWLAYRVE